MIEYRMRMMKPRNTVGFQFYIIAAGYYIIQVVSFNFSAWGLTTHSIYCSYLCINTHLLQFLFVALTSFFRFFAPKRMRSKKKLDLSF